MFGKWSTLILLNPVAPILEALNDCIIHQRSPNLWWMFYSAVASSVMLGVGYPTFKKLEPAFAESI